MASPSIQLGLIGRHYRVRFAHISYYTQQKSDPTNTGVVWEGYNLIELSVKYPAHQASSGYVDDIFHKLSTTNEDWMHWLEIQDFHGRWRPVDPTQEDGMDPRLFLCCVPAYLFAFHRNKPTQIQPSCPHGNRS